MIISKDRLILFIIFSTGLLGGVLGNIQIGSMRLQFLISSLSFLILFFILCKWIKFNPPLFIYPILTLVLISSVTISDQFGFIQLLYMLMPLLAFIVGASLNYNDSFQKKISVYLRNTSIILIFLSYITYFFEFSQFDSRPLSIYISLIVFLNLIINKSRYDILLSLFLIIFVLFSGARGALFAGLISIIVVYFFEKMSIFIASLFSLFAGIFVYIFSEILFYYIFSIDYLRQRTFYDGNYDYSKLVNFEFNSSGREIAWPIYWEHISKRFYDNNFFSILFGEGYGSVSEFGLNNVGDKWLHPHNEVIRLLFDFGLFGLFFILLFWFLLLKHVLWFGNKFERNLVIGLSSFTFIIMLTDNPLMYPLYYGNICLFMLGYCCSRIIGQSSHYLR